MKICILARTDEDADSIKQKGVDVRKVLSYPQVLLAVLNEEEVSQEKFGEKLKEMRRKYCEMFKTDQLVILVPKKEVRK